MSIDRHRVFKQSQSLESPIFCYWIEGRKRAQIEIIGAEFGRVPRGGSAHLGCQQCRFDDSGDAHRHLILEVENFFECSIETVGPQMCTASRVDKLCSNTHTARPPAFRTEPSSTYRTPSSRPTCFTSMA